MNKLICGSARKLALIALTTASMLAGCMAINRNATGGVEPSKAAEPKMATTEEGKNVYGKPLKPSKKTMDEVLKESVATISYSNDGNTYLITRDHKVYNANAESNSRAPKKISGKIDNYRSTAIMTTHASPQMMWVTTDFGTICLMYDYSNRTLTGCP